MINDKCSMLNDRFTMKNDERSMGQDRETVFLVDGTSYIHRAYHAIRNLSNSKGLPTNATFGFTKMILKLLDDTMPEYFAVILDAKGPNFRHKIYEEYKANRPPMPEMNGFSASRTGYFISSFIGRTPLARAVVT